jgi:5-methyltetrahydrofolate--homocysteine methyltransferase
MAGISPVAARLAAVGRRVLVLDGAVGTIVGGNPPDAVTLTDPDRVAALHARYLEAGADVLTTNTFQATSIAQQARGSALQTRTINIAAARLARSAVDAFAAPDPESRALVAGSIGPARGDRERVRAAYYEQADALIAGGVDLLLVETAVAAAQAADALTAIRDVSRTVPVVVSATIDRRGLLPSGETVTAFYGAVAEFAPAIVGLNCGVGVAGMRPALEELARAARCPVSCHPSAGLPGADGSYPEGPEAFAAAVGSLVGAGLAQIVGGCCGTGPAHTRALRNTLEVRS